MFSLWPRRDVIAAIFSIFSIPVRDRTNTRTTTNLTLLGQPVPQRKYELGDRVVIPYTVDDDRAHDHGVTYRDEGIVVGYWWNSNNFSSSLDSVEWHQQEWVYIVAYTRNYCHQSYCPFLELAGESELEPSHSVDTAQPTLSPSPYPPHKFALGQKVQWKFFCEEEKQTTYYIGRVIGVRWATWKKVYLYEVAIDSCSDEDFLTTIDELYESELEAAN